jgi:hypothetical protein
VEAGLEDDEFADEDAAELRRDEDHLRLVALLTAFYVPFVLFPLLAHLSQYWRLATSDVGAFLAFAHTLAAALLTPVVVWLVVTRRARTLCVVSAFLISWDWPAGTVLGVGLLVVLSRGSVADIFEDAAAARRSATADPDATRRAMARRAARRRTARRGADGQTASGTENGAEPPPPPRPDA